jgi:hypothetical protein
MQVEHLWTMEDVAEWEDLVLVDQGIRRRMGGSGIGDIALTISNPTARAGPFEVMAGEVASCPICGIEWTFDDQTDASKCVS